MIFTRCLSRSSLVVKIVGLFEIILCRWLWSIPISSRILNTLDIFSTVSFLKSICLRTLWTRTPFFSKYSLTFARAVCDCFISSSDFSSSCTVIWALDANFLANKKLIALDWPLNNNVRGVEAVRSRMILCTRFWRRDAILEKLLKLSPQSTLGSPMFL